MSEYPLYDGIPPHEQSETSLEAALDNLKTGAGKTQRERVHAYVNLQTHDGATDDEIEAALGMSHQTASPRRRELVLLEQLVNLGIRRRTRLGKPAWVHVCVEYAPPEILAKLKPKAPNGPLTQGGLFDAPPE